MPVQRKIRPDQWCSMDGLLAFIRMLAKPDAEHSNSTAASYWVIPTSKLDFEGLELKAFPTS